MSQEQKQQVEAQTLTEERETATAPSIEEDKQEREEKKVNRSRRSIWPVALAFTLCVLLVGFVTHPIVLWIGAILTVSAIVGWALERR